MGDPRTPTGKRILAQDYRGNEAYTVGREDILAIEAEAGALDAERLHHALFLAGQQIPLVDVEYAIKHYSLMGIRHDR